MKKKLDKEDFIRLPEYKGGSKVMKLFIDTNLVMPISAIENKIKDFVYLDYQVQYDGSVGAIKILKSVSEDCDLEAMRVVKMLKYIVPKNRGMKLYSSFKIKIHFDYRRYERKIIYEVKSTTQEKISQQNSYFYSINI